MFRSHIKVLLTEHKIIYIFNLPQCWFEFWRETSTKKGEIWLANCKGDRVADLWDSFSNIIQTLISVKHVVAG